MKYRVTELDPLLGKEVWEIEDCKGCNGKGRIWYPGCDDNTDQCYPCEGTGMIARKVNDV